jgi:hypothetical protein
MYRYAFIEAGFNKNYPYVPATYGAVSVAERRESKLFVSIVCMIGIASFSRHFHIIKVWFVPKAIEKLPLTRGI